jgi:hypothetical protein
MRDHESLGGELSDISAEGDADGLRETLAGFGVSRLLSEPRLLHKHVLGFIQLRLPLNVSGRIVRLHFWPAGDHYSEEPHTHLWPMRSHVIRGGMTNRNYSVAADPRSETEIFEVRKQHGGTERMATGEHVAAHCLEGERIAPGAHYDVPAGVFHTSAPSGPGAITIIVAGSEETRCPLVVSTRSSIRRGFAPFVPVEARDIADFADQLSKALS